MTRTAYILILLGIALLVVVLIVPFVIYPVSQSTSPAKTKAASPIILKSTDNGISWSPIVQSSDLVRNLPSTILSFSFDPRDSETIYLGTKGGGLWVTKNGGTSWAPMIDAAETLTATADIYDVSVSANSAIIYAATFQDNKGGVMRSVDGGISFQQVYAVPISRFGVFGISADPNRPNVVVMVTGQGGFFISQNGGVTWRVQKWFPDGLTKLIRSPGSSSEFYVLTSRNDLFHTTDAGESWLRLTGGYSGFSGATKIHDLIIDSSRPLVLYSASNFGLLRSEDAGVVWRPVRLIVPPESLSISSVAVDPQNSSRVLAAIKNQIYRTNDFGDNWQETGVPTTMTVKLLRFDPSDSRNVYIVVGK